MCDYYNLDEMSIVKSFSVGNGDMFYINHESKNFTTIDCCLDETTNPIADKILQEISRESNGKIRHFISTHPHKDHIKGLSKYIVPLGNNFYFYCVKNEVKSQGENKDLETYCQLRDGENCQYLKMEYIIPLSSQENPVSEEIKCLWPDLENEKFKELDKAKIGDNDDLNNISPIIIYTAHNGATFMWMGDLQNDFLEEIKENIVWPQVDILFAPHHGRKSGKVPLDVLNKINPQRIVLGNAPSKDQCDYERMGYKTLNHNSSGNIKFECVGNAIVINNDYTHPLYPRNPRNP